eukprot:s890_g24.t2
MQENSGAFLHVIREDLQITNQHHAWPVRQLIQDEPTPLLKPGERLIEICRLERKLEGIQVVLRTADSMPGNAPRDTRILVPEVLASPLIMDQVASAYNSCVVERIPGSADGEAMLLVAGPITSRIQAIQEFMSKTDRAHMEGIVVAKSVDGEIVGKDGRPRREIREALRIAAPGFSGCSGSIRPDLARSQSVLKVKAMPLSLRFNQQDEMANGYRPHRMEEVKDWQSPERNGRNGRAFESTESKEWERQPAIFHEPEPEAVHEIPTEDPWLQDENFSKRQDWNSHDPIEPQRQPGKFLEQLPDPATEPERRMPTLPSKTADYEQDWMLFCRVAMYCHTFFECSINFTMSSSNSDLSSQALQALAAATEAAPRVEAGNQRAELSVILGSEVLFQSLVPSGYLQDLSRRCQASALHRRCRQELSADLWVSVKQVYHTGIMLLGRLMRQGASVASRSSSLCSPAVPSLRRGFAAQARREDRRESDVVFLGGLFYLWHSTAVSAAPKVKQADAASAVEDSIHSEPQEAGWQSETQSQKVQQCHAVRPFEPDLIPEAMTKDDQRFDWVSTIGQGCGSNFLVPVAIANQKLTRDRRFCCRGALHHASQALENGTIPLKSAGEVATICHKVFIPHIPFLEQTCQSFAIVLGIT